MLLEENVVMKISRTLCLIELILDCFNEAQFIHTVCIYHTLIEIF